MGLISNTNLYFIHIPKNAGTSILKSYDLKKYLGHHPIEHHQLNIENLQKHVSKRIETFAIVRNPWDKFVSAYEYAKMKKSYWHNETNIHPLHDIVTNLSFEEFVDYVYQHKEKIDIIFEKFYHINSQHSWVCKNKVINVDHIIYYESLNEDLKHIGLKIIENINSSKRQFKSYQEYYNEKTKQMIQEIYLTDIILFGYSFD